MEQGRGIDLSGGGGQVLDLSGGASNFNNGASNFSNVDPPPTSNTYNTQGQAPSGGTSGGYVGQMGAELVKAGLQDSRVQEAIKAQAYDAAQQGWEAAKVGGVVAAGELHHYVQEGPAGISILCFLGGCATTIVGFIGGVLNLGAIFSEPFHWVLSMYLMGFGFVAVLLEADITKLRTVKFIGHFAPFFENQQMEICKRALFLTELRGRGLFYLFIGSLAITQCWWCLFFLVGIWNSVMGVMCLLMSFGINPADHLPTSLPTAGGGGSQQPNYGPVGGGQQGA
jgi:hypothetical protein